MKERIRVGDRVAAFHPAMFGVVKHGVVTRVGSKYVYVDFGEINGGIYRVPFVHVTERVAA